MVEGLGDSEFGADVTFGFVPVHLSVADSSVAFASDASHRLVVAYENIVPVRFSYLMVWN